MTHWTEEMFIDSPEAFAVTMRRRVERTGEEVDDLLALLAAHEVTPETALDVACGIGRHAVELAEAGVDVHGVDISPQYIEAAGERAAEAGLKGRASFEVDDMRNLDERDGTYDLVTNMWTAFGYFEEATNEAVAGGFRERVADDGALVMDLVNKEGVMADFRSSSAHENDGLLYVEQQDYTPETGRMETTLRLFRTGEEASDGSKGATNDDGTDGDPTYEHLGDLSWDLRLYSPAELRRLLERAGFRDVSMYSGLDGEALERDSPRLVVVAEP